MKLEYQEESIWGSTSGGSRSSFCEEDIHQREKGKGWGGKEGKRKQEEREATTLQVRGSGWLGVGSRQCRPFSWAPRCGGVRGKMTWSMIRDRVEAQEALQHSQCRQETEFFVVVVLFSKKKVVYKVSSSWKASYQGKQTRRKISP